MNFVQFLALIMFVAVFLAWTLTLDIGGINKQEVLDLQEEFSKIEKDFERLEISYDFMHSRLVRIEKGKR